MGKDLQPDGRYSSCPLLYLNEDDDEDEGKRIDDDDEWPPEWECELAADVLERGKLKSDIRAAERRAAEAKRPKPSAAEVEHKDRKRKLEVLVYKDREGDQESVVDKRKRCRTAGGSKAATPVSESHDDIAMKDGDDHLTEFRFWCEEDRNTASRALAAALPFPATNPTDFKVATFAD
jgi:hypothetical protein